MEIACTLITSYDTALITIYRPPGCPAKKFAEGIVKIEEWIDTIEAKLKKSPTIVIAGDLNFPTVKTWTEDDIARVSANVNARLANDAPVGTDKEQAAKLVDLIKKRALTQEVEIPTRGENTLDLIFCSNPDFIDYIETVENISLTDHKFVIAHLNKEAEILEEKGRKNFCSTVIPDYNLKNAKTEEWTAAREDFSIRASNFNLEASTNEIVEEVTKALEDTVVKCFSNAKPVTGVNSKSKSMIPKQQGQ